MYMCMYMYGLQTTLVAVFMVATTPSCLPSCLLSCVCSSIILLTSAHVPGLVSKTTAVW